MERKPVLIRFLVAVTAAAAAVLIAIGAMYKVSIPYARVNALQTEGRPRIGQLEARVQLLLIEDLRCEACQYFTQEIFPEIYERYIQTGRAYCVIVPVSFLEGSHYLANAALSIYQLAPDHFLSYLHSLVDFDNENEAGDDIQAQLVKLAEKFEGIDFGRLRNLIETNRFLPELERNFEWAKSVMGKNFGTPAFYVNGIRTPTSIEAIEAQIEKAERKR